MKGAGLSSRALIGDFLSREVPLRVLLFRPAILPAEPEKQRFAMTLCRSLAAVCLLAAVATACGGDDSGGTSSGGQGGSQVDGGSRADSTTTGGRAGASGGDRDAGPSDASTGGNGGTGGNREGGAAGAGTGGKGGAAGNAGTAGSSGKGGTAGNGGAAGNAGAGTGGSSAGAAGSGSGRDGGGGAAGSAGGNTGGAAGQSGNGGSAGTGGTPGDGGVKPCDLVAAPSGVDGAPGTLAEPTTLTSAITRIAAGCTIRLRGGTYAYAVQVTIDRANSGAGGKLKEIAPYAGEKPVLDFSSQPYGTGSNPRGLELDGSFWRVLGLEVKGSADNGIYVAGSGNVVERCVLHDNRDTGLQIGRASSSTPNNEWPSNNLILNCESYDNYDAPPGTGENADGFAAKLTSGTGNVFRGCVAHHNIDDGWDLFTKTDTGPIGPVTIDQCIAHHNGTLTNGTSNGNGDRNGFKLGGEDIAVPHVVTRSIAFGNGKNGFTWNSNPGEVHLANCLGFDNAEGNFKFGDNATPTAAIFVNNASFWTSAASAKSDKAVGTDLSSTNCWWDVSKAQPSVNGKGLIVDASDFAAALGQASVTRKADGSLDFSAFRLATGSDLLNAGVVPPPALPYDPATYYKGAPDIGAIESP